MADAQFLLLGDALWLEFVNTAHTPPGPVDTLADPGAWLRWTKAVRVEPPSDRAGFTEARAFRTKLLGLARLVGDLFELAKLDAHAIQPRRERFPAAELLQDIAQKYQIAAQEHRIEIDLAGGHRMRISGSYDPEALARLIRGLTA